MDADGDVYAADRSYGSGPYGYVRRGSTRSTGHSIAGTTEDGRYKNLREDMTAYKFAVANGFYQVDLSFAELQFRHVGDRVFDVSLEGTRVLRSLDIVEEAGARYTRARQDVRGRGDRRRARHRVRVAARPQADRQRASSSRACRRAAPAPDGPPQARGRASRRRRARSVSAAALSRPTRCRTSDHMHPTSRILTRIDLRLAPAANIWCIGARLSRGRS